MVNKKFMLKFTIKKRFWVSKATKTNKIKLFHPQIVVKILQHLVLIHFLFIFVWFINLSKIFMSLKKIN